MDDMNGSDGGVDVGARVVCMIDMLGQKKKLKRWPTLEELGSPSQEACDAITDTVDPLLTFGKQFAWFFDNMMAEHETRDIVLDTEEMRAGYERCRPCKVTVSRFSDTFLFHSQIVRQNRDHSVVALFHCLKTCCWAMLSSLANKVPLRGGISIGVGATLSDGHFYGPAMAEAYNLENEVAGYPRIVIGKEVRNFLDEQWEYSAHKGVASVMSHLAGLCRSLVCQDDDGCWIVDFLGEGIHTMFRTEPSCRAWKEWGAQGYDFVCAEMKRFQESRDQKLASRYQRLKSYMDARLPIWGMSPEA